MSLDLSATATSLLLNLASANYVKLVRKTKTYDGATGIETVSSTTVTDLFAADLPMRSSLVDGTRIRATDKMIIMDGKVKPEMTDFIRIANIDYPIVDITPINPAGVPQLYRVIARG